MPYIEKNRRVQFDDLIWSVISQVESPGELNYVITRLCKDYIDIYGESYSNYNMIHGVLTCVNQEFYRRFTASYEKKKIDENGDI